MDNNLDEFFKALGADVTIPVDGKAIFSLRREIMLLRDERDRAVDGLRRVDRIVGNAVSLGPTSCSAIRQCLFDVLRNIIAPIKPNKMVEVDAG